MYRDELEALQARLRTLEAELVAERKHRLAAEAEAKAARTAVEEAQMAARRASGAGAAPGLLRWARPWVLVVLAAVVLAGSSGVGFFWRLYRHQEARATRERVRAVVERQEMLKVRDELERLRKVNESQGLRMREDLRRCLPGRNKERGATQAGPAGEAPQPPTAPTEEITEEKKKARELQQQAAAAYVAGNHAQAIKLARQVLKLMPDHPMAIQIVGASSCYLKRPTVAIWAHGRLPTHQRKLLAKVCERNGITLPGSSSGE